MRNWFEKKVQPQRLVYHVAKTKVRNEILNDGLRPFAGNESGKWSFKGDDCYPPMIFANNSDSIERFFYIEDRYCANFDGLDIWEIDTHSISNEWFLDLNLYHSEIHICTPKPIPTYALTLRQFADVICPYCKCLDWGRGIDVMLKKDYEYQGMWCGSCNPDGHFFEEYQ